MEREVVGEGGEEGENERDEKEEGWRERGAERTEAG